jgi:hypothetical protein
MFKLEEKTVADFVSGATTEDAFLRVTAGFWRRRGEDLYRNWRRKLPPSVDAGDVTQELMTQALIAGRKADAGRGDLAAYVVWSAVHRTQREIHRMRGARLHGNDAKNPGRPEVTFADYEGRRAKRSTDGETRNYTALDMAPTAAEQDRDAEIRQTLTFAIEASTSPREAMVLLALRESGGSSDTAAVRLFEDFAADFGIENVEQARRVVGRTVIDVFGGAHAA